MKKEISNHDDIIDSRDIIERIDELENMSLDEDGNGLDEDETKELEILYALAKEGEDYSPDWKYGETLIRDTYFKDYAREMAYDIGAIDPNANWPTTCIDWDEVADELKMDYSIIDYGGIDYWIRSC